MMQGNRGFFAGSTIRQEAPQRSLAQCGACGLYRTCETPKMPVSGQGERRILIVCDAPGVEEDETGTAFADQSGSYIKNVLRGLRVDASVDVWKTNAVICRPRIHTPTQAQIIYCRPNMTRTIKTLKPDVIIPMGQQAVESVLGGVWKESVGAMARWAGWCIPSHTLNAWVCPTWHPDFVMQENDEVITRQFRDHIKKAVSHTAKPWPTGPPQWAKEVKRVMDPDKAAAWLRKCATQERGAIAWDYETNMLKPDGPDARIVSCAVAWGRKDPERCIAFPWTGDAVVAMGELLRSPIQKIASNLKFEDRWTRKAFGHRVRAWVWDTMVAAHVLDNRPAITSVKFQSFIRLGTPVWNEKVEPFLKSKGDATTNKIFEQIDIYDLLTYNGLDALLEFRVAVDQMNEMGYPIPWKM